jgi:predicted deacetylase
MAQQIFDSLDYGFRWVDPTPADPMGWYEFDARPAEQAARRARDARARELRRAGHTVRVFALPAQLRSRGGVGSGRPHIEVFASAYGLNY